MDIATPLVIKRTTETVDNRPYRTHRGAFFDGNVCWVVLAVYLFDLDGTLVDRHSSLEVFLPEQYARYRTLDVSTATFTERFFSLDQNGHAPKHGLYKTLADQFKLSASVAELIADFRTNAFKACTLQPGALVVLEHLRRRGVRLGVVSRTARLLLSNRSLTLRG